MRGRTCVRPADVIPPPPRSLGSIVSRRVAPAVAPGVLAIVLAACGSAGGSATRAASAHAAATPNAASPATTGSAQSATTTTRPRAVRRPRNSAPADRYPAVLTPRWQTIAEVGGQPALWIAQRSGVTLVRMAQGLVHLALHAGSADPGGGGWRYGPAVAGREIHHLILAINGGFKFNTGAGGFESFGRTAVALAPGLGSIVTYAGGRTDIGAWRSTVPAAGRPLASVRQNLHLLVDGGAPAASVTGCGASCWGLTVGGVTAVARSGLGIRADGQLLWAAGEGLSVAQLADAMAAAGVRRGVELDINPDWVAGYLYVHHRVGSPTPVPVVPGQYGISGQLLTPYGRDFFTVLSN